MVRLQTLFIATVFFLCSCTTAVKRVETGKDAQFIAYSDGTVLDSRTGFMWAAQDNGCDIDWSAAKLYCENYRGGNYTDWRLPTKEELAGLYNAQGRITSLIRISGSNVWSSELMTIGSKSAYTALRVNGDGWLLLQPTESLNFQLRVLPVRRGK